MAIEDDIKFLERVPMLRLVGRAGLRIIAIGSEIRYVHGGEVLFHKDTHSDGGYVVQEGAFSLSSDPEAHTRDLIAGPGTLMADMALMTETKHGLTATAIEPATVVRIPRSLFLKMLEGYPDAARRLHEHIAARSDRTARDLLGVHQRLASRDRSS